MKAGWNSEGWHYVWRSLSWDGSYLQPIIWEIVVPVHCSLQLPTAGCARNECVPALNSKLYGAHSLLCLSHDLRGLLQQQVLLTPSIYAWEVHEIIK